MRTMTTASIAAIAMALLAAPASAQTPWSVTGALEDGDSVGDEQHRYDEHRVRLDGGQRYRISVNSEAFDPVARLYGAGESEPVAENDDSGESLNSRISYVPAASGDFVLRVVGFAAEARGAYTAEVAALPPLPAPISEPGSTVATSGTWLLWEGDLGPTDADREGHPYDDYLVHFDAGQRRFISLEGNGFDTVVQVLRASEREGGAIEQDDDTGVGFNSLLAFAPEEAGDYIVRVTSFGEGATGAYRLWVSQ